MTSRAGSPQSLSSDRNNAASMAVEGLITLKRLQVPDSQGAVHGTTYNSFSLKPSLEASDSIHVPPQCPLAAHSFQIPDFEGGVVGTRDCQLPVEVCGRVANCLLVARQSTNTLAGEDIPNSGGLIVGRADDAALPVHVAAQVCHPVCVSLKLVDDGPGVYVPIMHCPVVVSTEDTVAIPVDHESGDGTLVAFICAQTLHVLQVPYAYSSVSRPGDTNVVGKVGVVTDQTSTLVSRHLVLAGQCQCVPDAERPVARTSGSKAFVEVGAYGQYSTVFPS
mmetsp:Transcript_86213/g.192795  ORF Transcript_86213/g.192795 Transcript_86213/m.192795 type:complete len:278 (+) Transcript_86213:109-942(+)